MTNCQEEILNDLAGIVRQNFASMDLEHNSAIPQSIPYTILIAIFEYLDQNRRFMKAITKGDLAFHKKWMKYRALLIFHVCSLPLIKSE